MVILVSLEMKWRFTKEGYVQDISWFCVKYLLVPDFGFISFPCFSLNSVYIFVLKPSSPWCAIARHIDQLLYRLSCHVYLCFSSFQQVAESKLAKFVEDIIVPPRMVDIIVDSEVIDVTSSWHALPYVFLFTCAYGKYLGSVDMFLDLCFNIEISARPPVILIIIFSSESVSK